MPTEKLKLSDIVEPISLANLDVPMAPLPSRPSPPAPDRGLTLAGPKRAAQQGTVVAILADLVVRKKKLKTLNLRIPEWLAVELDRVVNQAKADGTPLVKEHVVAKGIMMVLGVTEP